MDLNWGAGSKEPWLLPGATLGSNLASPVSPSPWLSLGALSPETIAEVLAEGVGFAGGQLGHDAGVSLCRYSLGIFSRLCQSLSAQGAPYAWLCLLQRPWPGQASLPIHWASGLLCVLAASESGIIDEFGFSLQEHLITYNLAHSSDVRWNPG